MEQLKTIPVRQVVLANSTVLPHDVVRTAVKRSGLIGSPLQMDRVQELARFLKRWYARKGYGKLKHTKEGFEVCFSFQQKY